jgi:hypothetical protein
MTEQMLERLLAGQEQMMAKMKAELETNQDRMKSKIEAKMDSHHEELMVIIKAGQEKTRARDGGLSRKDGGHGFGGKS